MHILVSFDKMKRTYSETKEWAGYDSDPDYCYDKQCEMCGKWVAIDEWSGPSSSERSGAEAAGPLDEDWKEELRHLNK